ncbi:hypothetical protein [Nocardiopsis ansamitocini]|uniref:CsbD family protein n=1 Tax=Nocardiopsis ansamitocini TaxID=1670832 RepID=A0A9W6P445_9ACTN|nr:hypothetical protein [Nocardiopsis ansamitocini]GLU46811.1 hypothetical protein Nans01_11620 [Nocardiopsis ansamitocini]
MSVAKKAAAKGQQVKGKIEQAVGDAVGNEDLKGKGHRDVLEGRLRETGAEIGIEVAKARKKL